ncbi:MAG: hypothetical protein IT371_25475 [Deltaproteobacteria bacterium]|nr:hypothetical protein [Deltaproteobacteria bacterium]
MHARLGRLVQGVLLCVGLAGCVSVAGGALEAGWELRGFDGRRIGCTEGGVGAVRFTLQPMAGGGDPCATEASCRFDCDRGVGTSGFVIPEGRYAVAILPLDLEGKPLTVQHGVRVPLPVVRDLREGELTNLNVNLIIVER